MHLFSKCSSSSVHCSECSSAILTETSYKISTAMKNLSKEERFAIKNAERSKITIPNMLYKDNPPQFISIIGPYSSGKTEILSSLVQHFTGRALDPAGLITFSLREKRVTLCEVRPVLPAIIDAVKVSDIVILPVSITTGLEKETLETITMILSHGAAKPVVVFTAPEGKPGLTKIYKAAKEKMVRILQREHPMISDIFDLQSDGIAKIARQLSLIKTRPIKWKCTHPHVVVDRKHNEYLYGYVRGGPLKKGTSVHVPGLGDFVLNKLERQDDPSPLKDKKRSLYAPSIVEQIEEGSSGEAEELDLGTAEIKLFSSNRPISAESQNEGSTQLLSEPAEDFSKPSGSTAEPSPPQLAPHENPLERIKRRFNKEEMNEELCIKRIEEECEKKGPSGKTFLQVQKEQEAERVKELEHITEALIPGTYCRFILSGSSTPAYDPKALLVVGAYLPTEKSNTIIKGQVLKNKWQKKDLKTNAPFFISAGWCRFQSIPVFSVEGRAQKYLRASSGSRASDVLFYGPSLPVGTGFFLFSPEASYRILAAGSITDSSGDVQVKKKLKLVGFPVNVMGNNAVIQSMFTSDKEVDRFVNARLKCASGLRGIVKKPVGRGGHFRGTFEGPMLMSDVVTLRCFVKLEPHKYMMHMSENARYVRGLWELKQQHDDVSDTAVNSTTTNNTMNNDSTHSDDDFEEKDERIEKLQKEIASVERMLPFDRNRIRVVKEDIGLPVPPEQRRILRERQEIEDEKARRKEEYSKEQKIEEERKEARKQHKRLEREQHKRKLAMENKIFKKNRRRA